MGGDKEGIEGMLGVFSEGTQSWTDYFFDVSGTKIQYYASEAERQKSNPIHVMVLDDVSKVTEKPDDASASASATVAANGNCRI